MAALPFATNVSARPRTLRPRLGDWWSWVQIPPPRPIPPHRLSSCRVPELPRRRAVAVLLPLILLTAGLAAIDLFDGTVGLGEVGRVVAGLTVFAVAAAVGWVLTRDMTPNGGR